MKYFFTITLTYLVATVALGQTDITLDNQDGIFFKNASGVTDGTKIFRRNANALSIQYELNSLRFDALDNKAIVIKNSAGETNIQLHPNGNSAFEIKSFGLGLSAAAIDEDYRLHIRKGDQSMIKIENIGSGSGSLAFANSNGMQSRFQFNSTGGLNFQNYDGSVFNTIFKITNDGKVGIGTNSPTKKLEVNGTIRSKEVIVEASPWPDYVFEADYNLRSLEETEAYIKTNKHLPEIPSAKEMEANGVQLGEMNMLLLKKIEELTLYILEQEKRIQKLEDIK